ncbi:MAG TPA: hypothetical protein VF600_11465 [Abditibacteriaceae bacterium]
MKSTNRVLKRVAAVGVTLMPSVQTPVNVGRRKSRNGQQKECDP